MVATGRRRAPQAPAVLFAALVIASMIQIAHAIDSVTLFPGAGSGVADLPQHQAAVRRFTEGQPVQLKLHGALGRCRKPPCTVRGKVLSVNYKKAGLSKLTVDVAAGPGLRYTLTRVKCPPAPGRCQFKLAVRRGPFVGDPSPDESYLFVSNGGPWGDWTDVARCPDGSWASAMATRVEAYQGGGEEDDTALNAISLTCTTNEGVFKKDIAAHSGNWGDWAGAAGGDSGSGVCAPGQHIVGLRLQVQALRGACQQDPNGYTTQNDDVSASEVDMVCGSGDGKTFGDTLTTANAVNWSAHSSDRDAVGFQWGAWAYCPPGTAVAGIKVRFEAGQGPGICLYSDDTTLNDVALLCNALPAASQ